MARTKSFGGGKLDKLYSVIAKANKEARVNTKWKKKNELCAVDSKGKHPCKTVYQSKTGKMVTVRTSRTASFGMPKRLRSVADLRGAPGIRLPRNLGGPKKKSAGKRRKSRGGRARARAGMTPMQRGTSELLAAAKRTYSSGGKRSPYPISHRS
jgi:hypothetical protein